VISSAKHAWHSCPINTIIILGIITILDGQFHPHALSYCTTHIFKRLMWRFGFFTQWIGERVRKIKALNGYVHLTFFTWSCFNLCIFQGKIPYVPSKFITIPCVPLSGNREFFCVCMTCGASGIQEMSIFFDGTQVIPPFFNRLLPLDFLVIFFATFSIYNGCSFHPWLSLDGLDKVWEIL
jgi:hypothetical protein